MKKTIYNPTSLLLYLRSCYELAELEGVTTEEFTRRYQERKL